MPWEAIAAIFALGGCMNSVLAYSRNDQSRYPVVGARRSFPAASGVARIAGLGAMLLGGGIFFPAEVAAQGAPPPAPPVTVSEPLQREITEWDEYTGQFAAVDYVEIRARVSGYLQSIGFQDGEIVKKGDVLFQIDSRPFEIALASAQAQVKQAQAQLDLANVQLSRASELRQRDFVAASTYDQRNEEMRQAGAALETAQAAVRSAQLNIEFAHITAPITGRISRHEVSIGNLVTGGEGGQTTLLTTIVSLDPIYFYFDMSEADYLAYQRAVAAGKLKSTRDGSVTAQVKLADETDWGKHEGKLDFVDNQVDRGAGTIRARTVFPNPNYFVTPGQFGRLRLPGSEPYVATLIPDAALVTDQSRKIVMTVAADGTVVPKVVRPGPMADELGLRIIRDGLAPGDKVIINGLMRARPGAKVTPQPGKIEPATSAQTQPQRAG
jgi:RND family efflux transporter MFP subunit